MSLLKPSCLLCNAPLSHLQQVRKERLCGVHCQARYAVLPPHEICTICGRVLTPHQFGARLCGSADCHRKQQEEAKERERRERQILQEKADALLGRVASSVEFQDANGYLPIVVPSSSSRIVNLPERRRRDFRDYLNCLISEATARPAQKASTPAPPRPGPAPEVQAVLGKGCGVCLGRCCENGGERAYLTADRIRRYMAEHPRQRPRDVLAAYLGYVGNKTAEGSCVYHGPQGCSLPRDMRSDICNTFFCTGLVELQQRLTPETPPRAFFVSMRGRTVQRAAFCDENEFRPVPDSLTSEPEAECAVESPTSEH